MSDQRGATLTSAQQAAVAATEGPVLIIAGPGSGKTHTLVARIVHLVTDCGVAPEEILVSTFTDKAAAELVSRVSTALGAAGVAVNLNEMLIGTLHSLCLRLVDEHREFTRLKRNYTVLDQFEQQYLLFRRMREFRAVEGIEAVIGAGLQSGWDIAEKLARRFNQCSEELLDADTLSQSDHADVAALGRLYERYLALLVEENSLDFSTIQVEAWRLLDSRPEALAALQERVRYLMVDEYQDTNTVQEAILALLAGKHGNLCVVGDDDQGLYRFRGATIRNILEFPSLLPDRTCNRVVLRDNFRSHPDVVEFFQQWMARTDWQKGGRSFRFSKDIDASGGQTWAGPGVLRVGVPETEAWQAEVIAFLHHLQATGRLTDWNQVAFLFRSVKHDKAIGLARALEAAGIPVYAPRSGLFFERTEVRRMVGALISVFPQWQPTLQEGWPVGAPPPPVWAWYDACVGEFADALADPEHADLLRWCRQKVRAHAAGEETPYAFSGLFYQLLQFRMFAGYLGEPALGSVLDSRPARNLAILSGLLTRFEYLHHVDVLKPDRLPKILSWLGNTYLRFLFDGGIEEFEDPSDYAPAGCVGFLTVHQSKGLEFPVVVVDSLYAVPTKSHDDLDVRLHAE
ncbi:MAG: UvrD-helicase domain-containing protein, partial [Myxococcota bacterium]